MEKKRKSSCFCGQVAFGAVSHPVLSAYCHCTQCQKLTGDQRWVYLACLLVHTMHFVDTDSRWTSTGDPPETALDTYDNLLKLHKRRYRCKTCGVCAVSYNKMTRRFSVYTGVFYGTRVMDIEDELDKREGYEGDSTRLG
ncbi:hypothetical protein EV401DRAFT_2054672 [Pisolithus croceorrhizus]|nr:hypothetical protein EV401DRAFT_2054672 [Pisolithus croceorrhizus]